MNEKAKKMLGSSSSGKVELTKEQLEEGKRKRHRASLQADRAIQKAHSKR